MRWTAPSTPSDAHHAPPYPHRPTPSHLPRILIPSCSPRSTPSSTSSHPSSSPYLSFPSSLLHSSPRLASPRHMTRGSDDWRGGGLMFAPSVSAPVAAMLHQHMFESTGAGASDRRNAGPGGAGEFDVCPRVSSASLSLWWAGHARQLCWPSQAEQGTAGWGFAGDEREHDQGVEIPLSSALILLSLCSSTLVCSAA